MAAGEHARQGSDEGGVVVPLPGLPTAPRGPKPAPDASEDADPVTGLPGPARFAEFVAGAARRRRGDEHAWAAVAVLDGLDAIGARDDRRAADVLLRTVALALRSAL